MSLSLSSLSPSYSSYTQLMKLIHTQKQTPHNLLPKLFGELRQRYAARPGGYTRILRTEPKSQYDQGDSAILELVDGPRDLRFAVTAAAVARDRRLGRPSTELTRRNVAKVTRFRPEGASAFQDMVKRVAGLSLGGGARRKDDDGGGEGKGKEEAPAS